MSPGSRRASPQSAREVVELDRDEAMRLLASVDHGRVVFTRAALPAIRPVNHLVVDGRVIGRTRLTAKVSVAVRSSADAGVVVAYEADDLDPRRRTGWSVSCCPRTSAWSRRTCPSSWVCYAGRVLSRHVVTATR